MAPPLTSHLLLLVSQATQAICVTANWHPHFRFLTSPSLPLPHPLFVIIYKGEFLFAFLDELDHFTPVNSIYIYIYIIHCFRHNIYLYELPSLLEVLLSMKVKCYNDLNYCTFYSNYKNLVLVIVGDINLDPSIFSPSKLDLPATKCKFLFHNSCWTSWL